MIITPKVKRLLACLMSLTVIMSTLPVQAATGDIKPVGSLPQGSTVYDPTWIWEYKNGGNYTGTGAKKVVEWTVVAQNHYTNAVSGTVTGDHTTLHTREPIASIPFDNSTNRGSAYGLNHWGNSGTPNASMGARTFLNNTFYNAMPQKLKDNILVTKVPNITSHAATNYVSQDNLFLPSHIEMGFNYGGYSPDMGTNWGFYKTEYSRQTSQLGEFPNQWLRGSNRHDNYTVSAIEKNGVHHPFDSFYPVNYSFCVRPAMNIKASTEVREVGTGKYEILYNSPPILAITNPTDQTINQTGIITISGTVKDVDNDNVTITATVLGVKKTVTVSNTETQQEWSLSWTGAELPEGVANTTTVQATDSPAG